MIDLKKPNSNPHLKDVLEENERNIFLKMNCHAIGTIESFNSENQTVEVSINYLRTYMRNGQRVTKAYPLLLDVPVVMMTGGGATLTFPIEQGDTCVVLFNDRSISQWWASGQVAQLESNRAHALSDGMALIGIRSNVNKLTDYDENRALLSKGTHAIGVGDKVMITKNYPTSDQTLNTSLQDLIDKLKELIAEIADIRVLGVQTGGGTSGFPINATAISDISTDLDTIASDLGDLLE